MYELDRERLSELSGNNCLAPERDTCRLFVSAASTGKVKKTKYK